jgi:hypothetical protein
MDNCGVIDLIFDGIGNKINGGIKIIIGVWFLFNFIYMIHHELVIVNFLCFIFIRQGQNIRDTLVGRR